MPTLTIQLVISVILGITAHCCYFIRDERDLAAARIATFHVLACFATALTKWHLEVVAPKQALTESIVLIAGYTATLLASITTYRLLFSPLRYVRGPLRLKLSKLAHVWDMVNHQNCKLLENLRREYGDVVRTGPNEVTLFGADAFHKVHGPESKCGRAAYYDLLHPMVSLDTTRDKVVHDHRRKLWDRAFSMKSLEKAEPMIYSHAEKLVSQLRQRVNESVDISVWLEYYTFDLMGLFGLTIDFNNLTKGEHPILSLYHLAHRKLGPLAAAPWIKHLLMGIPYIERMKYYRQFMDWAHGELERNIEMNKESRQNVIGYVLDDAIAHGGIKKNWNYVLGDFVLVIVAGSDPVRQVLANMMYYLIVNSSHLPKLREELDSINIRDYKSLQQLVHLNACIYETLRLNPAVPSSGLRLPPKDGLVIGDTYIPEGTTIVTPQYSLLRDERNYVRAEEWIPERFSTQPNLILNKSAFVPWSIGKLSCIGKNLSLMEIRVAAALILNTFNFDFAPGEDSQKMFTEATDYFTTTPGPLRLIFKERRVPKGGQVC